MTTSLRIDPEFQALIPPLTEDELTGLEQDILTRGCLDTLKVWREAEVVSCGGCYKDVKGNDLEIDEDVFRCPDCGYGITREDYTLIDGHNRYAICQKHGLDFETQEIELADRYEVKVWIIRNQFGRRNLTAYQRSVLALKMEEMFREKAQANLRRAGESTHSNQYAKVQPLENSPKAALPDKATPTPFVEFQQAYHEKKQTTPINTRVELAKLAGVSDNTIAKVKKIEQTAPPEVRMKVERGEMSINEAYKQVKRETQAEQRKQIAVSLVTSTQSCYTSLTEIPRKYRVVYADPPWSYGNDQTQAMPGSTRPEDHYSTMSTDAICALPIQRIVLDDAVLFLWTTTAHLEEAFRVVAAWGFTYKTNFVWHKLRHNYGPYSSVRHEHLLLATRGSCTPEKSGSEKSVIEIDRSETHSEKPAAFREIIDRMYPFGSKIELFSRQQNEGWDVWGNQVIS